MPINFKNINIEDFKFDIATLLSKQKIIIAVVTSIVALFIVTNIYKAQRTKIKLVTIEIGEGEAINKIVETIQLQEKVISEDFSLFTEKDATLLMQGISEIATVSDIRIGSLNPLPKVKAGLIKRMPFKLQITGNYYDIGEFIGRIESSENVFKIDKFYLSNPSASKVPNAGEEEILVGTVIISAISIEGK